MITIAGYEEAGLKIISSERFNKCKLQKIYRLNLWISSDFKNKTLINCIAKLDIFF